MIIINMTPHKVTILDENNLIITEIPPSGKTIRLTVKIQQIGEYAGIPISKSVFGEPIGLPEFVPGYNYIVSQLVKAAFPERIDLLVPAEMQRDNSGNIIGCRSLGM